jgi:hypothetical protein
MRKLTFKILVIFQDPFFALDAHIGKVVLKRSPTNSIRKYNGSLSLVPSTSYLKLTTSMSSATRFMASTRTNLLKDVVWKLVPQLLTLGRVFVRLSHY